MSFIDNPSSPGDVTARIDAAWADLIDAIEGVPADRLGEKGVCGDWSVQDLMGHTAFWDEQGLAEARRRAAGAEPRQIDFQALNDQEAAAYPSCTLAGQQQRMTDAHARAMQELRSMPTLDHAWVAVDMSDHYQEHAAEIRAWRAERGL